MVSIPKIGYIGRKIFKGNKYKENVWNQKEINAILDNYKIKYWKFYKKLGGGNSDNILIYTNKGKKVIKRYYWSLPSTIYEHSILQFLAKKNFPVPHLEINNEGETYTKIDEKHYAVSEFKEGHSCHLFYMSKKTMEQYVFLAGEKLAQLHELITGFRANGKKLNGYMPDGVRLWRGVDWHLKILDEFTKQKESDKRGKFLLSIKDEFKDKLIELGQYYEKPNKEFDKIIIHGDYSPQNILFNNNTISAILDFGDANLNLRLNDVARGIETFSRSAEFNFNSKYAKNFIKSYNKQNRVTEKEVEAIPDLIMWRQLRNIIWSLNSVLESHKNSLPPDEHLSKIILKWKRTLYIEKIKNEIKNKLKI